MLQGVENRREGAAQFMGQQGHEFFLAPIGFGQAVCPLPLGLRRLAFGEVVHHPGERPGLFVLVEQRRHDCLTPKPCAVLPNLPAIAVSPTVGQRRLEFMLGLARDECLRAKRSGKSAAR